MDQPAVPAGLVVVRRWNPDSVAEPIGAFSHLSEVGPGHRLIFLSGQVGTARDGSLAGSDSESQTRAALANIERLLASAGAAPEHIIKLLTFVAGREQLAGFLLARDATFSRWYPDQLFPTHSLAIVSALVRPEMVVEIEAVLAVPA